MFCAAPTLWSARKGVESSVSSFDTSIKFHFADSLGSSSHHTDTGALMQVLLNSLQSHPSASLLFFTSAML